MFGLTISPTASTCMTAQLSLLGNTGNNTLQFGFTKVINVPVSGGRTISGSDGDDTMSTAFDNDNGTAVPETTYDGGAHVSGDTVYIVLTPPQFDYLTTAQILHVNGYLAAPTGNALDLKIINPTGGATVLDINAINFESAKIAVYDDGLILDITTCFTPITSDTQIITGSDSPTAGDTSLSGTQATDLIFGQRGNDTIYGDLGNDCVFGGAGQRCCIRRFGWRSARGRQRQRHAVGRS
jgi:Ca2+-binding RTX toxin-like protein